MIPKSIKNAEDISKLRTDLETVYNWAYLNNMCLNGQKFQHIMYGRTSDPGGYSSPDNNPITTVEEAMDLGVIMESSGKSQPKIEQLHKKVGEMPVGF